MGYVYNSANCKVCGRDKRMVAQHLINSEYSLESRAPNWLNWPYCYECFDNKCRDFSDKAAADSPHWQCQELQVVERMGEHPPRYRGYCQKHWEERTYCSVQGCDNRKEPWESMCRKHRAAADAVRDVKAIKRWRDAGILCPSCKRAPQNVPQRFCKACLIQRGKPLWEPVPAPLQAAVRSWATVEPGRPQNLAYSEHLERGQEVKRQRKRKQARNKRWAERRAGKKQLTPLPPKVPRPRIPKAVPLKHERKWKPAFWTGLE